MKAQNVKITETDSQLQRFKEAARELGCDEDEAAFDEKIRAIVKKPTRDGSDKKTSGQ